MRHMAKRRSIARIQVCPYSDWLSFFVVLLKPEGNQAHSARALPGRAGGKGGGVEVNPSVEMGVATTDFGAAAMRFSRSVETAALGSKPDCAWRICLSRPTSNSCSGVS